MKILFPYLARARAANWSRYQQLLSARARAGDDVTFLEPPARASEETNFQEVAAVFPERFRLEEIKIPPAFWNFRFPFDKIVKKGAYSLAANRRARKIVARERPELLLVYNLTQGALLRLPLFSVFDVADDLPAMLRVEGGVFGAPLERLARRTLTRMIGRASMVTTPSRVLLPGLGPKALFVPNGVDPEEIARARARREPRTVDSTLRFRIGFLGSFEYFIDFDLILGLAGRLADVDFLLIGGGRRLREIRERVGVLRLANVEFAGPLAHEAALARLAGCDLSVCPFTRDDVGNSASPLKLYESLALGVPVLATRTREIEAENPPNVFFADRIEEALESVRAYLARPIADRLAQCDAARDEILKKRSWDSIGKEWMDDISRITI